MLLRFFPLSAWLRPSGVLTVIVAVTAMAIVFTPSDSTTTPANASLAQAQTLKWGDSDCDDSVTLADALSVLLAYASLAQDQIACEQGLHVGSSIGAFPSDTVVSGSPVDYVKYAGYWGDYTCSQTVDAHDAVWVLYGVLQLDTDVNIGCPGINDDNDIYIIPFTHNPGPVGAVEIDTDSSENTANAVGLTQKCREVAATDNFTVDVVVKNIPALQAGGTLSEGGLAGFEFNLLYNADIVNIIGIDVRQMLTIDQSNLVTFNDPVPDGDGTLKVSAYDLGYHYESGNGALVRLTVRAVGPGVSNLLLGPVRGSAGVTVIDKVNWIYDISLIDGAQIAVNSPGFCPTVPTPTPTPIPTATPVPTPSPAPTPGEPNDCLNEDPPIDIPDNDPNGIEVSHARGEVGTVDSVSVCLNLAVQWAGDIVGTLTHEDTGTTRTLVNRLGNGVGTCSGGGNGIYAYLTDDPASPQRSLEDACSESVNIIGEFFPNQPFTFGVEPHFGGEAVAGTWTLKISDENGGGTAQLRGWQLYINEAP